MRVNKMKQKWIARLLTMIMIFSMVITNDVPPSVFAGEPVAVADQGTLNTIEGSQITPSIATGSVITLTAPIELSTTATATGAAIKYKVNDGAEKDYTGGFTLADGGVGVGATSATVSAYTCSTEDSNIKSVTSVFTYTMQGAPAITQKDLIFSEYIEGSSNNKAIEIFNGTGADVDLSAYSVLIYSNGATTGIQTTLSGTLTNGDVYIIFNSGAIDAIKSVGDLSSGAANFNGDDALELRKGSVTIDVFGVIGVDPGTAWIDGSSSTLDKTLVRKSSVLAGNTTFSFGEWDCYEKDTLSYLGSHTMDDVVSNNVAAVIGSPVNGSTLYNANEITLSCTTEGSKISYRMNGTGEWIVYTDKVTLQAVDKKVVVEVMAEAEGKTTSKGTLNYNLYTDSDLVTIAIARAGSSGTNYLVKGVVTFIDGQSVYIQDATGGIVVRFSANQTLKIGDEIVVSGIYAMYNGLLQLGSATLVRGAQAATLPEPEVITLEEAFTYAENYEAKRIRINNVVLGDILTAGNTTITDGTNIMNIYKGPTPVKAKKNDTVDVIAVMSQYSTTGTGGYQLRIADVVDIIWVSSPSVATVTASPSGGEVLVDTKVQLTCATSGAAIWYKIDGGTPIEYIAPFAVTKACSVETYAVKDGIEGSKSILSFTIGDGKTNISEARAIFVDTTNTDKKATITGIVTFIDGSNVYMQDASAGIVVYFKGGTVSAKPSGLEVGKELTVSGKLTEYKGLLEITELTQAVVGETKALPAAKLIDLDTIDAMGLEALESQRIRVEGSTLGTINTTGDTPITSSQGKSFNLYKMPTLTGIVTGDIIDVVAVVGQYTNYQLRVVDKSDITKAIDKYSPVIKTTNLENAQAGKDYRAIVVVTDSTGVKEVKLSYNADGTTEKQVALVQTIDGQYEYTISATELTGTKLTLRFTATDTMDPANAGTVTVEKEIIDLPRQLSVVPANGSSTGEGAEGNQPFISTSFENAGEAPTVVMKLDSVEVKANLSKEGQIYTASYNTLVALSDGKHTVEMSITRQDHKSISYSWDFNVGKLEYNVYFGQIHAHSNLSDGVGEVEEAFQYAAKKAENIDFLAITDHSNWLEDVAGTNNIADATKSTKWVRGKQAAADITKEVPGFVGIYAYEMTWSGGSIGHMNTFNTPGFENRNNATFKTTTALKTYFDALKTQPQSISMFNHPGKTFGDFGDFSYYDPQIDQLVTMIEVGNGEGLVHQSGYFPSFEFYTRALDKGWHLSPTNNQDNHKGKWGDANTARTVILAPELTEESIYDAMRDMRVYASEDNDLSIVYTLNNNIMGSILADTDQPVNISVDVQEPDNEAIGKVEVIVNGGIVAASKQVMTSDETVEFTLPSTYTYYYIRITQPDNDIAVTAPVWVGELEKCGISKSEINKELAIKGEEIEITTSYYNNESLPLGINKLEYSMNGKTIKTITGLGTLASLSQGKTSFKYTSLVAGSVNIDVKLYVTLDGVEKVYTDVIKIAFQDQSIVSKVIVDGTHFNDYVYGYYSGNMGNFAKIAAKEMTQVEVITDKNKLTPEVLANTGLLIISVPSRWAGYLNYDNLPTVVSPFSDEYIAMVKKYVDNGGNLVICGISDREDRPDSIGTQASTQINKLLAGIGSTTRINSDEATDFTTNGGQEYRLYLKKYNMSSDFLQGVEDAQQYSMYKGCSLILDPLTVAAGKVQWLVKGHSTTTTKDITQNDNNYVKATDGDVVVLASEQLAGGGFMLVGGSVFMSNFEVQAELDNFGDLQYANYNIVLNAVKKAAKEIKVTSIAEARKGTKGEVFTVEGIVTAGTESGNAFFDTIYIQDSTGGMDIFPINESGIKLGQKVRVTGTLADYENDLELMVIKVTVIDSNINKLQPEVVTTAVAANYTTTGGKLIKVTGTVTKVEKVEGTVSYIIVKDASGVPIRVFINGYINSSTGVDPTKKLVVGDIISAVGLSSMDTEGVRIRVRDRAEIIIKTVPPVTTIPEPQVTQIPIPTSAPIVSSTVTKDKLNITVDMTLNKETSTEFNLPINYQDIEKQLERNVVSNLEIEVQLPNSAFDNPKTSIKLDADIIATAKEYKKSLEVSVKDKDGRERYTWTMDVKQLANSEKDIKDLDLYLDVKDVSEYSEIMRTLTSESKIQGLVVEFGYHGELPAQTKVRIYVGNQKGVTVGSSVVLYHLNTETGKLDELPNSSYTVDQDGYITIDIVHCSKYVILPETVSSNQIVSTLDQIKVQSLVKQLYLGGNVESTSIKLILPSTLEIVSSLKSSTTQSAIGGVVVTYSSANKKVATVDKNGNILAKGVGTTKITTRITIYSGETKIFITNITIKKPYISLNTKTTHIKIGEAFTFKATGYGVDVKDIVWKTTKKSILVINKKTGKAVGKTIGTDYIIANIGGVSVMLKVEVTE